MPIERDGNTDKETTPDQNNQIAAIEKELRALLVSRLRGEFVIAIDGSGIKSVKEVGIKSIEQLIKKHL